MSAFDMRERLIKALRKGWRNARALLGRPFAAVRGAGRAARAGVLARVRDFGLAHPARALALTRLARRAAPRHSGLSGAEALLRARALGWAALAPAQGTAAQGAAALLAPPSPAAPSRLALPAAARAARLAETDAARIVVYTARFGEGPELPPVFGAPEGCRFLCFTDRPGETEGWRRIETAPDPLALARCKILAAQTLAEAAPEAEASLWLDPDRLLVGNLDTFLSRWAKDCAFLLWRHPLSADWSDLAERHLVGGVVPAATIVAQADACAKAGLRRGAGCFDTGALWRRHGAPEVAALMQRWWEAEREAPGADDLSLLRALGDGPPPTIAPLALGQAEDGMFFARLKRRRVVAPKAAALAAPGVARARVPITFVYSTRLPNSTTTLLRGKQLSELIAARWGDLYDVTYTSDMDSVRDQVVLATKEALWLGRTADLAALRARNLAMIGSWEDANPMPEKTPLLDAMMTLSIRAMLDMNRSWPNIPSFHVTHNVNTAVPVLEPPTDRLRTGYFGDLPNTVRPDVLANDVDLVNADSIGLRAKGISTDWLEALPHYNCHWIVRNRRPLDGWKPFLKGFVAARCGAAVIVTRDDQNAAHYLGDDYPFYAESVAPADLEAAWVRTAAAFGGPEWRFALDIMRQVKARSSDAQVAAEFRAMIDAVVG